MSWAVGFDSTWNRDIGYGVPATCDRPKCGEAINRGLSFVCGSEPRGGEDGCGLYFCEAHLAGVVESTETDDLTVRYAYVCERCEAGEPPFEPTPDTAEWLNWKLADESWAQWRIENAAEVERITALVGADS